ncbi:MAG: hypothetical protein EBR51_06045, partial [Gammaproteobacteria bacterium]|nr:hypothetical protein [Gammaproteobacteria bacterium]
ARDNGTRARRDNAPTAEVAAASPAPASTPGLKPTMIRPDDGSTRNGWRATGFHSVVGGRAVAVSDSIPTSSVAASLSIP